MPQKCTDLVLKPLGMTNFSVKALGLLPSRDEQEAEISRRSSSFSIQLQSINKCSHCPQEYNSKGRNSLLSIYHHHHSYLLHFISNSHWVSSIPSFLIVHMTYPPLSPSYEQLLIYPLLPSMTKWGTGGCRCRQCVPCVLEFAIADDVDNRQLEHGARRALV